MALTLVAAQPDQPRPDRCGWCGEDAGWCKATGGRWTCEGVDKMALALADTETAPVIRRPFRVRRAS